MTRSGKSIRTGKLAGFTPIPFHSTKYGPELLVDIAAVRQMPGFILDHPHTLGFYDIILVTAGRGWFSLDGSRYPVKPGALFFTAPGQVRDWKVRDLDGICLFFPALFLEEFFTDPFFLDRLGYFRASSGHASMYLPPRRAARLRSRLTAMQRELGRLRSDSVHLLRAKVYETLITLARLHAAAHRGGFERAAHQVTSRYLALLDRGVSGMVRVRAYASDLGVSPGYLNRLCRRHLGRGAKELIADRLLLEARRRLLYTEASIAQVAATLGFQDPSYFSRFFRANTGRSPLEFRAGHR